MTLNLIQTLCSQWSSGNQRIAEYKFQVIMAFKHCVVWVFFIKHKGSWVLVEASHADVSNFLERCIFHVNFCLISILCVVLELQIYKKSSVSYSWPWQNYMKMKLKDSHCVLTSQQLQRSVTQRYHRGKVWGFFQKCVDRCFITSQNLVIPTWSPLCIKISLWIGIDWNCESLP